MATASNSLKIHAESVLLGCAFQVTPVSPIPVLQTALARTLTSPDSFTQISGLPKSGYMTMDSTRKLLLLLQTDPKAPNLPLVGIWLSGVNSVTHPDVWSACTHFAHNRNLRDRALTSSDQFLLLLYLQLDPKKLEFWGCRLMAEEPFVSLHSCHEAVNLEDTNTESEPHLLELIPAIESPHAKLFTDIVSGLQLHHPVQSIESFDATSSESFPRPQLCQPTALLPAVIPDLSKSCDLSICINDSTEQNQEQSLGSQSSNLSVQMPLQPISPGNKPATTADLVKVVKQLPLGNRNAEDKENQSMNSSLESGESSPRVARSEVVDLKGSLDGNQLSSVMACRLLKRQEEQLKQMQLQIEMLLNGQHRQVTHSLPHPQSEKGNNTSQSSSQSSSSSKPSSPAPGKTSVSTNTGQSLIWSSTKSPAVTMTTDQENEASSRDNSLVEELSPLSSCICVHQEGDMARSLTSSIHAVDLQSFNGDSTEMSESLMKETIPGSMSQLSSPAFGESASQASVLPGNFKEEKYEQGTDQSEKADAANEFHDIVDRIEVFLKEQSIVQAENQPTAQSSVHEEDSQLASKAGSSSNTLSPSANGHGVGLDKDAVMKVLFGNPKKRGMTPSDYNRAPVVSEHPRINYRSLSVNETMDESFDVSDVIALQYLTNVSHPDFAHVLDKHRIPNVSELARSNEPASVRLNGPDSFYDRNLSLASRQYLQRHNLLPGIDRATESFASQCPEREITEGNDQVLDVQRLKNLPKLF
jgi:hypothetical protein